MPLKHAVYDSDTHFSINPVTRSLKNEGSSKNILIQFDHRSERMTFEIPRYIEGHDMDQCNVVQVHFTNVDSNTREQNADVYTVDDLQISPESDETVIFSWLVSQNATQFVGPLNFLVRFACVEDGKVLYVWNTAIYSNFSVIPGMNNGNTIVEIHPDALLNIEARLKDVELIAGAKIVPFNYGYLYETHICSTFVPFAEIYQAYQDGKAVVARTGNDVNFTHYYLSTITEDEVKFVRSYYDGSTVVVDTITLASNQTATFVRGSGGTSVPTPAINTDKKITETGYYHVYVYKTGAEWSYESFGVHFFDVNGMGYNCYAGDLRLLFAGTTDTLSVHSATRTVDANGKVTTTYADVTSSYTICTAKVG